MTNNDIQSQVKSQQMALQQMVQKSEHLIVFRGSIWYKAHNYNIKSQYYQPSNKH